MKHYLVAAVLCVALSSPAAATDWYVDGARGNNHNYGSLREPFHDFWFVTHVVKPGDTIHLLPTITYPGLYIGGTQLQGEAGAPITIRGEGAGPRMTEIRNGGGKKFAVYVDTAHYITLENLDVSGNESAFFIKNSTHITVAHNRAHDSGGAGIQTVESDYITMLGNVVYNNSWDSSSGSFGSGISTLWDANSDNNTKDAKMIISGNIIFNNHNTPRKPGAPCNSGDECNVYGQDSDGSGIIIDRINGSVPSLLKHATAEKPAYHGRTLIANNLIWGNGGRGIHVYESDHVTIVNNTVLLNNQDPYEASWHPGEIMAVSSGDVAIYNNIAYSDGATGSKLTGSHFSVAVESASDDAGPITISSNLLYNSKGDDAHMFFIPPLGWSNGNKNIVVCDQRNIWGDPQFIHISDNPALADLHVHSDSPAIASGDPTMASETDIANVARGTAPDIGAYQRIE